MNTFIRYFVIAILFLGTGVIGYSQLINIPENYPTIQAGVNSAQDGDTVLVAPGEYFENINMNGKNILLASRFVIDGNPDHINNTIINGSQAVDKDTASCILIVSGENDNCVVAGFTITGGKGTRWEDEHNPGLWFKEGGGILIQYSSPTIRNNVIRDNEAVLRNWRHTSAGGGAIRMGDSNPRILNNYIHHNKGRYGGGIVLNYSGALIRNNLIVSNSGGQDFGGGGLWILGNSDDPRILENNTIVKNSSTNVGGGVRIWMSSVILSNNIIRANHGTSGPQIHGTGVWTYCNIEGGKEGEGNIDELIRFDSPLMFLPEGDLSIDAGNPHISYNDIEDPDSPGNPLFPSQGTIRNDMGVYGGPGAMEFPVPDLSGIIKTPQRTDMDFNIFPNPANNNFSIGLPSDISLPASLEIINMAGQSLMKMQITDLHSTLLISPVNHGIEKGLFFIRLSSQEVSITKKLLLE